METHFFHNEAGHQFELQKYGQTAFVEYFSEADKIFLTHTEVPEALQGQGFASELIGYTLQHIRRAGKLVVPQCAFVAHYIDTHPEWHSILPEGYQM